MNSLNNGRLFRFLLVVLLGMMVVTMSFFFAFMIFFVSAIVASVFLNVQEERLAFGVTDFLSVAGAIMLLFTIEILLQHDVAKYLVKKEVERYHVISGVIFFYGICLLLLSAYVYPQLLLDILPYTLFAIIGGCLFWLSANFNSLKGKRGTYLMAAWVLFLAITTGYKIAKSVQDVMKAIASASPFIVLITLFILYSAIKRLDVLLKLKQTSFIEYEYCRARILPNV